MKTKNDAVVIRELVVFRVEITNDDFTRRFYVFDPEDGEIYEAYSALGTSELVKEVIKRKDHRRQFRE